MRKALNVETSTYEVNDKVDVLVSSGSVDRGVITHKMQMDRYRVAFTGDVDGWKKRYTLIVGAESLRPIGEGEVLHG